MSFNQHKIWYFSAFIWGLAEASVFFIVPDVLISFAVLKLGWRKSLSLIFFATFGALLGVSIMYLWAKESPIAANYILNIMPGISEEMLDKFRIELTNEPLMIALLRAGLSGVPIKIAATFLPTIGIPLSYFIINAAVARLFRFFISYLITVVFFKASNSLRESTRYLILLVFWIVFYSVYFCIN